MEYNLYVIFLHKYAHLLHNHRRNSQTAKKSDFFSIGLYMGLFTKIYVLDLDTLHISTHVLILLDSLSHKIWCEVNFSAILHCYTPKESTYQPSFQAISHGFNFS